MEVEGATHKTRATLTGCCLLANCLLIVCFVDTATAMLTATSTATASATGCCCVGMRSTHALLPTSRRPTSSLLRFCLPQTAHCTPPGLALKNICFMFAFCFQARCALASLALTLSPARSLSNSLSVCGSFLATRLQLTGCVSRACPKQQQWQQQQLSVPASTPARTERARLATCHETRSSSSSSSISRRNAHTHTQRERERENISKVIFTRKICRNSIKNALGTKGN